MIGGGPVKPILPAKRSTLLKSPQPAGRYNPTTRYAAHTTHNPSPAPAGRVGADSHGREGGYGDGEGAYAVAAGRPAPGAAPVGRVLPAAGVDGGLHPGPAVGDRADGRQVRPQERLPHVDPAADPRGLPGPDLRGPAERAGSPPGHAPRDPRRAVLLRGVPGRHPDRDRAAGGQDRPAAVLPPGRPGPAAPLPLEVHHLLPLDRPVELPVPGQGGEEPGRGGVHRQGPPAPVRRAEPEHAERGDAGPGGVLTARSQKSEVRSRESP